MKRHVISERKSEKMNKGECVCVCKFCSNDNDRTKEPKIRRKRRSKATHNYIK